MVSRVMAVLLAILVANPVCCCTIGELLGAGQSRDGAASCPACCAAKKSQQQDSPDQPGQDSGCPCEKDRSALVESKTPHFDGFSSWDFVLDPPIAIEIPYVPVAASAAHPRRLDLPPPPPSWRLHCRYLL